MSAEALPPIAEAAKPDVLGSLGIDLKLFLAQLVNVGIVIFVCWKWVFKPLIKTVDERTKKIEDGLKNAKEADLKLADASKMEAELLSSAKLEARKIIDDSVTAGEKERAERVDRSKKEMDMQVEDAKVKIREERQQALDQVRREVAGLVMQATKKVTSGTIDEAAQKAQVEQALKELEQAEL